MHIQPIMPICLKNSNYKTIVNYKENLKTETNATILPSFVDAKCYANINFKADIHDYAYNGYLEYVKRELQNGINVNIQDKNDWTPLLFACYKGHLDIVKYLRERGADLNIQEEDGNTPLHWACYNKHLDIVKYLCKQKGIDLNIQNDGSWTPLHYVCYYGCSNITKFLIEQDQIDLTLKNYNGNMAVNVAKNEGYENTDWYKILKEKTDYQLAHPETIGISKPLSKEQEAQEAQRLKEQKEQEVQRLKEQVEQEAQRLKEQAEKRAGINKLKQELTQKEQIYNTRMGTLARLLGQNIEITAENFEKLVKEAYSDRVLQEKMAELAEREQELTNLIRLKKSLIAQDVEVAISKFRKQDESVEKMGYAAQIIRITKILMEYRRRLEGTSDETPANIVKALQDNNGKISNDGLEFINRIFKSCESVTADDLEDSIKSVKNESGYIDLKKVGLFLSSLEWGTRKLSGKEQAKINEHKQKLTQQKQDYDTRIETLARLLGSGIEITAGNFKMLVKEAYSDQVLQEKMTECAEREQELTNLMNMKKSFIAQGVEAAKSGFRVLYGIEQDKSIENMGYAEQMNRITKVLLENKKKLQGTNDETPENIVKALQDNNGKISNDGLEFINRIFESYDDLIEADDLENSIKFVKNENGYINLEKVGLFLASIAWGTAIKTAIEKVKTMPSKIK